MGCDPNEVTIARRGLGKHCLDECPTQTMAAVDFVNPKLPDLRHARPAVPCDRSYLHAIRVERLKCQT